MVQREAILLMEKHKFPKHYKTSIAKMKHIVNTYGETFATKYEDKIIPLIVKPRYITPTSYHFRISINYPSTKNMTYMTLSIHLGYPNDDTGKFQPHNAYIEYVQENVEHGLSGKFIMNFAIAFLDYLGVHKVALYDAATKKMIDADNTKKTCQIPLSFLLFVKERATFYGRFGFRPVQSPFDTSFPTSKARLLALCKSGKKLQSIKIQQLVDYLTHLINTFTLLMSDNKKRHKVKLVIRKIDMETGIPNEFTHNAFLKEQMIEDLQKKRELLESIGLDKTLQEVFTSLTCSRYSTLQIVLVRIMETEYVINEEVISNEFNDLYNQVARLSKGNYELDLKSNDRISNFCPE